MRSFSKDELLNKPISEEVVWVGSFSLGAVLVHSIRSRCGAVLLFVRAGAMTSVVLRSAIFPRWLGLCRSG